METIIQGGTLMLFIGNNPDSIPLATSHTLRITGETEDASHKDLSSQKWKSSTMKGLSWEATTDNLYSEAGVTMLHNLMVAGTPIDAFFFAKNEADGTDLPGTGSWTPSTSKYGFSGQVVITSLEITAQNGENATFSATFTGHGLLKYGIYGETRCSHVNFIPGTWTSGDSITITLKCSTPGSRIYYTLNGQDPTRNSSLYDDVNKITLTSSKSIKAFAVADGYTDGQIGLISYTKPQ